MKLLHLGRQHLPALGSGSLDSIGGARSWLLSLPAWQGCDLGLARCVLLLGAFVNRQLCAGENGGTLAGPPSAASSLGRGGLVPKASGQRKSVTEGHSGLLRSLPWEVLCSDQAPQQ